MNIKNYSLIKLFDLIVIKNYSVIKLYHLTILLKVIVLLFMLFGLIIIKN